MSKNYCDIHQKHFGRGFAGRGRRRCYDCERNVVINTNRYKLMANVGAVVDVVPDANGAWVKWEDCQARVAELEAGIEAALAIIPGAVRVREGGAHEDLLASLAVTASKLNHSR